MLTKDADPKRHNGWANYETWVVNLWLMNDERSYQIITDMFEQHADKGIGVVAEALKEAVEEMNPLAGQNNLYTDLLAYALGDVDWLEIAEHHKDDWS